MAQTDDGFVEHRRVIWIHDRLYGEYIRMAAERFHRAEDHGLSAYCTILFWPACTGAKPAPGCDEDGCCTLGFGHWARLKMILIEEGVGLVGDSPYHAACAKTERFPLAVGKAVFVAVHLHK
jgi:hypothetical protein